jgi:hypothetical protein
MLIRPNGCPWKKQESPRELDFVTTLRHFGGAIAFGRSCPHTWFMIPSELIDKAAWGFVFAGPDTCNYQGPSFLRNNL